MPTYKDVQVHTCSSAPLPTTSDSQHNCLYGCLTQLDRTNPRSGQEQELSCELRRPLMYSKHPAVTRALQSNQHSAATLSSSYREAAVLGKNQTCLAAESFARHGVRVLPKSISKLLARASHRGKLPEDSKEFGFGDVSSFSVVAGIHVYL